MNSCQLFIYYFSMKGLDEVAKKTAEFRRNGQTNRPEFQA